MNTKRIRADSVGRIEYRSRVAALLLAVMVLCGAFFAAEAAPPDRIERMSFVEANVGYILQSLGRIYGVNFSISTFAANKKVSIEFSDITFEQALSMISKAAGIVASEAGERFYVVQAQEESSGKDVEGQLVTETQREETRREERLTTALVEVVSVKYVSVPDVEAAIRGTIGEENSALVRITNVSTETTRSYGKLVVSAPNSAILNTVKRIISIIDTPKPMVEIEVLFVELIRSSDSSTGVDLDIAKSPILFQEVNNPEGASDGLFIPTNPLSFGQFYKMNPWQAEATIKALKGNSKSRVLADPKVRVMSGRQAVFSSETQVPILSRNSDGEVNTEWKNVGIHLEILPTVLGDGVIHMKASPRASSITGEKRLGDVVAPVISERKADTEVLMAPGETMVIGGLMNDKEIRTLSKVPLLSQIPLLGALFQSEKKENEKSTVVIFLRPRFVEESLATAEATTPRDLTGMKTRADSLFVPATAEKNPSFQEASIAKIRRDIEAGASASSVRDNPNPSEEVKIAAPSKPFHPVPEIPAPEVKKRPPEKPLSLPAPSGEKETADVSQPSYLHSAAALEKIRTEIAKSAKILEKKQEALPASVVAQEPSEPPAQEKPVPDPSPRAWERVGDVDEYLSKLLDSYNGEEEKIAAVESEKPASANTVPASASPSKQEGSPTAESGDKNRQDDAEWTPPLK